MRRHRTTAVFLLLACLPAATLATTASGRDGVGTVPRLVFPLVAKTVLWDNYGDPRPNRRHAGTGGRWLDVDPREIELTVPLGTDAQPFAQFASATLRPLKRPADVTAFTLKANSTRAAIAGAPGELLLGRIVPTP